LADSAQKKAPHPVSEVLLINTIYSPTISGSHPWGWWLYELEQPVFAVMLTAAACLQYYPGDTDQRSAPMALTRKPAASSSDLLPGL